ncbi:MAG: O-antigen ligase family protein [Candidatus Levybacteria bacterium]|nr:O-antigen ligase family protein [Candidatus Levybacteria bacterium]
MKRAILFLTYLLICIFPLGLLFRVRLVSGVQIIPQDIVVLGIMFLTIIYYVKDHRKLEFKEFFLFQALFIAVGLISLVVNHFIYRDINLTASFLYVIRYASYVSLLAIGPLFEKSKSIKNTLIFSGGVFVLFGFIQFILFNDLRKLFYLGWDEHLYRLFSTLFDPNFAGIWYVLFFLLLLNIVAKEKYEKSYKALIVAFFTIVAIYLTYSRTALVALVAGVTTMGIVRRKFKVLLLSFAAFIILLVTVSDISIEGLNPLRTVSTFDRIKSMNEAVDIIRKSNFMGVGFNAFRYAQVRYGIRNPIGAAVSNSDAGTDNSLLFVTATTGIAGGVLYLLSYVFLIKNLVYERNSFNFTLICMLVSIGVGSFFVNVLFYTPVLAWLFLLIGFRRKLN